jgi:acetyl esterase/lipase
MPAGGVPGGPPQPFSVTPTYEDVAYANVSETHKLDIYVPSGPGPHPTVIYFHPGAFMFGDKTDIPDSTGKALLKDGYALVGVNYRLSGEAKFPAAVQDAKASARFLRANAAEYDLDPDNFVAWGASAGGNLAALVGVSDGAAYFDDPSLGNPGVSGGVEAVIDWFGPTNFGLLDEQAKAQGSPASDQTHNDANSPESLYLGAALPTVPDLVEKSNPITYVGEGDPPFLVQKGSKDCTVAIENTKMMANALRDAGVRAEYDLLEGAGHGGQQFETDANNQRVLDFLHSVTGEPPGGGIAMPETGGPSLVTVLLAGSAFLLLAAGGY